MAVLFILAVASIGVYGILLGGWSSGSTYPLLGALRSSAQVISYEIAMGMSLVAVFLYAGSMSTSQIVEQQKHLWFIIPAFFSFIVYIITMVGETNRLPFDLAEGEGELTGGFHTEYSSLKFALFFLAEYVNMVTVSALATTMFLGGWRSPWPISLIDHDVFNRYALLAVRRLHGQALGLPVLLRLAARLAAPGALRPVHAARLEGAHPGLAGLDRLRRRDPRRAAVHHGRPAQHDHRDRRHRRAPDRGDAAACPADERQARARLADRRGRPVRRRAPGAAAARPDR